MEITVSRESVCLGDDIEEHTIAQTIGETTTFSDLFRNLIRQKYFPNIEGNDVIWVLHCGEDDLVTWKTKEDKLYNRFVAEEPAILSVERWASVDAVHFSYYAAPIKRAEQIFRMFETYHIQKSVEDDWSNAF